MNRRIVGPGCVVVGLLLGSAFLPQPASAQASATATAQTKRPPKGKTNRDIITRAEIDAHSAVNLYDLVMSARSQWMRGSAVVRSSVTITLTPEFGNQQQRKGGDPDDDPTTGVGAGRLPPVVVWLDGRRFGSLATLRTMPAESAEKLCYFTLNRAQSRFGMSVESPVIEVFTRNSSNAETAC